MTMNSITLILPNQLFEYHPAVDKARYCLLVEHARFFTDFPFHQQKILFHRASMHAYEKLLTKKHHNVTYLQCMNTAQLIAWCTKHKVHEIHLAAVADTKLEHELIREVKKHDITLVWYATPLILSPDSFLEEQFAHKEHYFMHSFYQAQRKRMDILMVKGKPVGGRWSYDTENREKFSTSVPVPALPTIKSTAAFKEVVGSTQKEYKQNPGNLEDWVYPTTHHEAHLWLENFLEKKLSLFGPYQDSMNIKQDFMFHSLLSPMINAGLLTPQQVVDATLDYAKHHKVPINSLEGFIRQVIGWREFVYGAYRFKGEYQRKQNFFEHTRKLPASFWDGSTGITPIDMTIEKTLNYAYAHHIERLMILGNFMMLCEVDPHEVYAWFMTFFIDAYDWVMVPNVYGMSQYADGGLITTKPYMSSSAYIKRMSNYPKGDWCSIWDSLYWRFIFVHQKTLLQNARLKIIALYMQRLNKKTLADHIARADDYLATW